METIVTLIIIVLFIIIVSKLYHLSLFVKPVQILYKGILEQLTIGDHEYETLYLAHCNNDNSLIIVHIPGNPGIISFYENFFSILYESFHGEINIIGASNRGLIKNTWIESLRQGFFFGKNFSLKDQVDHHLDFLRYLIKKYPKSKFILTAHSLGSYVLLEVLKHLPKEKIRKGIMICPAIEDLSKSVNGIKRLYRLTREYKAFVYLSSFILSLLIFVPYQLKKGILSYVSTEEHIVEGVMRLHNFNVALSYINLGAESMIYVTNLNETAIKKNEKKLWFLYTMYDDWIPLYLYNKNRKKFKNAHFYLDHGRIQHAYIFKGLNETVQFINNCANNKPIVI